MKVIQLCLLHISYAFALLARPIAFRQSRHVLHIDAEIAKLIDDQLWRQNHKSEVEATWHNKNDPLLDRHVVPDNFEFGEELIVQDINNDHVMILNRQLEKDKRMARNNPSAYCADRCLATGNCDVWEDVFHLSPTEVMAFCHDCVLSDGEEPCDIPPHMLEEGFAKLKP